LNAKSFGQNVYRQRMALKMSQERFSEKAEITRAYLQRIEAGTVNPSLRVVRQIKKACNCSWDDLLGKP
jgi:transcriptional regulator with XRE-family HTH domain